MESFLSLAAVLFKAAAIFIAFDIFEFTKAVASAAQGDNLPKNTGALTLDPFKHFEPIGFILMFFTGVGWGQPVQTSQYSYKDKRIGNFITYLSPMAVMLVLALMLKITDGILSGVMGASVAYVWVSAFIYTLRDTFVTVAVINIIPVPPFSGSRLIRCFLSPNAQVSYSRNERIFQMVMIFLLLFGLLSPAINVVKSALMLVF